MCKKDPDPVFKIPITQPDPDPAGPDQQHGLSSYGLLPGIELVVAAQHDDAAPGNAQGEQHLHMATLFRDCRMQEGTKDFYVPVPTQDGKLGGLWHSPAGCEGGFVHALMKVVWTSLVDHVYLMCMQWVDFTPQH